jgi:hypothetical protein
LDALRQGGLEAALGRRLCVPGDVPEGLRRAAERLAAELATAVVAGDAEDRRLEANRRHRELVRALTGPSLVEAAAVGALAGLQPWRASAADASGWLQHPLGSLAWWRREPDGALEAALRRAAIAALAARLLEQTPAPSLEAVMRPLLGRELDALAWRARGESQVRLLGLHPRRGLVRAADGSWRRVELPAEGAWVLLPGEALVLGSPTSAPLDHVWSERLGLPDGADDVALARWVARACREADGPVATLYAAWSTQPEEG